MQRGGGHDRAAGARQVARRGRRIDDGRAVSEIEGAAGRRVDAHVRHEAREDQLLAPERREARFEIRPDERIGIRLDDDGFAVRRSDDVRDRSEPVARSYGEPGPASCWTCTIGVPTARARSSSARASTSAGSTPTSAIVPVR